MHSSARVEGLGVPDARRDRKSHPNQAPKSGGPPSTPSQRPKPGGPPAMPSRSGSFDLVWAGSFPYGRPLELASPEPRTDRTSPGPDAEQARADLEPLGAVATFRLQKRVPHVPPPFAPRHPSAMPSKGSLAKPPPRPHPPPPAAAAANSVGGGKNTHKTRASLWFCHSPTQVSYIAVACCCRQLVLQRQALSTGFLHFRRLLLYTGGLSVNR